MSVSSTIVRTKPGAEIEASAVMQKDANRTSKQVLIIRRDLGMRRGKQIAQGAHASMKVLLDMMPREEDESGMAVTEERYIKYDKGSAVDDWINGIFTKITVSVDSEEALHSVYQQALRAKLPAAIIQDVGKTEFGGVPTFTAVAIGPAWADEIDPITGKLPLL